MDVMLSLPLLCTPSLSSIQPGLTWPTDGGVWVLTFEDHYNSSWPLHGALLWNIDLDSLQATAGAA